MQGKVTLILRKKDGSICSERTAKNSVMRGGAELLARLFSGQGNPISHMGVGMNDEPVPEDYSLASLKNDIVDEKPSLSGETTAALGPADFSISVNEEKRVVTVKIRGTLPDAAAVGTIKEAGLLSKSEGPDVLYNRVTFAPLEKGIDHELTLFWEVSFPYGDLQWY